MTGSVAAGRRACWRVRGGFRCMPDLKRLLALARDCIAAGRCALLRGPLQSQDGRSWKHIAVMRRLGAVLRALLFAFGEAAAARFGFGGGGVRARGVAREECACAPWRCSCESRIEGWIGFAAVGFGSPVLLEIAPDVLAVTIAGSGLADGRALGLEARAQDRSVARVIGSGVGWGKGRRASR